MFLGACGTYKVLALFLNPESIIAVDFDDYRHQDLGIVIYGYLGLKSKLVNFLFG